MRVRRLRWDHLAAPLGTSRTDPLLSWAVEGDRAPTSVRVRVASDPSRLATPDRWDSGPLPGDTASVRYAGAPLASRDVAYWTVEAVGDGGPAIGGPARAELGLLHEDDWDAGWIGLPWSRVGRDHRPCPYLRREFEVDGEVSRARLYVSALGLYRVWLDGVEVTDDRLVPGWTDYHQRTPYRTYDVTGLLGPGRHAIGALLGEGWWCGRVGLHGQRDRYGSRPHLRLQLEVWTSDGGSTRVVSDRSWRGTFGGVLRSDLLLGEVADTRREPTGWTRPGFDDTSWSPASVGAPPCGPMVGSAGPPVRARSELAVVGVTESRPDRRVYDLGQNAAGWTRALVEGPAGSSVTLRHGEALERGGRLHRGNLRTADATDRYVLRGGRQVLEPTFTTHGFRYVEIEAQPDVTVLGVTGVVVHSDLDPAGAFACSDPVLEGIVRAVTWSHRSNAVEIPTDCPQRDERLGWTGDGYSSAPTGIYLHDTIAWLGRWIEEVRLAQADDGSFPDVAPLATSPHLELRYGAPGWGDAGVEVPWLLYQWTGDVRFVEEGLPASRRWVDLIAGANPSGVWEHRRGNDYGDWLSWEETPKDLVATAILARSAATTATMAAVVGDHDGASRYGSVAASVREAFARTFVGADGRVASGTQTAYALALRWGLVPGGQRGAAGRHLAEAVERWPHPAVGYVGVPHLLPALTEAGRTDLAYAVVLNEEFPGWAHNVRHGATTIWERWDGWTPDRGLRPPVLNSLNHTTLGAVGEWVYRTVGGIAPDPAAPGFGNVVVRPEPGGNLTWATARLDTVRGEVAVAWSRDDRDVELEVQVPATATATVHVPGSGEVAAPAGARPLDDDGVFQVGAGLHRFRRAAGSS